MRHDEQASVGTSRPARAGFLSLELRSRKRQIVAGALAAVAMLSVCVGLAYYVVVSKVEARLSSIDRAYLYESRGYSDITNELIARVGLYRNEVDAEIAHLAIQSDRAREAQEIALRSLMHQQQAALEDIRTESKKWSAEIATRQADIQSISSTFAIEISDARAKANAVAESLAAANDSVLRASAAHRAEYDEVARRLSDLAGEVASVTGQYAAVRDSVAQEVAMQVREGQRSARDEIQRLEALLVAGMGGVDQVRAQLAVTESRLVEAGDRGDEVKNELSRTELRWLSIVQELTTKVDVISRAADLDRAQERAKSAEFTAVVAEVQRLSAELAWNMNRKVVCDAVGTAQEACQSELVTAGGTAAARAAQWATAIDLLRNDLKSRTPTGLPLDVQGKLDELGLMSVKLSAGASAQSADNVRIQIEKRTLSILEWLRQRASCQP